MTQGLDAGVPVLVAVDMDHAAARETIAAVAKAGGRVLAFGTEVDDISTAAVMALGATEVADRAHLQRELERSLPRRV